MSLSARVFFFIVLFTGIARAGDTVEPARVLDRFHQAAAQADLDTYLSLLTADMVFLGTDGSERREGQAFRDFVQLNFSEGRGWRYTPGQRSIATSPDGNTAWFDESLHNNRLGQCRGSGVMLKTDDGWKIAQYSLSIPVPETLVEQVIADIAAAEGGGEAAGGGASLETAATGVESDPEPATSRSGDCMRKRHKTNRKAGC